MDNKLNSRLFWFAPGLTRWDLSNPAMLRTVVQQVLTHGRMEEVRMLLNQLPRSQFQNCFEKLKRFLPNNVRTFWEAYFGDH